LWVHAFASLAWIIGVAFVALVASAAGGVLTPASRRRLGGLYRRWGAWLHWALVGLVVATGIYNLARITPFALVWQPSRWAELESIPYGVLYQGILVGKLILFGVLLLSATLFTRRVRRTWDHEDFGHRRLWQTLGVAGVTYLALAPTIVAAAAALRYVHVLSHVATAAR